MEDEIKEMLSHDFEGKNYKKSKMIHSCNFKDLRSLEKKDFSKMKKIQKPIREEYNRYLQ